MSPRKIVLIVAALIITAGTGLVARSWVAARNNVAEPVVVAEAPRGIEVLVARTDIPTGAFLQEQQLRWQHWPDEDIPETFQTKKDVSIEDILGSVVRRGLGAGEPITAKRVIKPGERGFLAAVLKPGWRAVAVRVNATSGISGLVFPGDRIDLILTHKVKGEVVEGGKGSRRASETILTNVRILAVDQVIDNSSGKPKVAKNVTLEVTPKQAEVLAVVDELGSLSFSLRSLAKDEDELERIAKGEDPLEEPDPKPGVTYTWDNEASKLVGRKKRVLSVARGTAVEEKRY